MAVFSAGGASAFAVTTNTPQTIVGAKNFTAGSATSVPLVVQGAASQTANLQEWKNNAGTVLGTVANDGRVSTPRVNAGGSEAAFGNTGATANLFAPTAGQTVLLVRGAAAQTANLQEWQNGSGTVLGQATNDGGLFFGGAYLLGGTSANNNSFHIAALIQTATNRGIVVRGAASQTADLQQWQDSAGTVLAAVTGNGIVKFTATTGSHVFGPDGGMNSRLAVTTTAATVGLTVRGAASQTSNLAEFQNSAGTVLSSILANGVAALDQSGAGTSSFGSVANLASTNARVAIDTFATGAKGLVIRGVAGQTANLAEFQNSAGTVMVGVSATGRFHWDASFETATAGALAGYLIIDVGGIDRKLPYYVV